MPLGLKEGLPPLSRKRPESGLMVLTPSLTVAGLYEFSAGLPLATHTKHLTGPLRNKENWATITQQLKESALWLRRPWNDNARTREGESEHPDELKENDTAGRARNTATIQHQKGSEQCHTRPPTQTAEFITVNGIPFRPVSCHIPIITFHMLSVCLQILEIKFHKFFTQPISPKRPPSHHPFIH